MGKVGRQLVLTLLLIVLSGCAGQGVPACADNTTAIPRAPIGAQAEYHLEDETGKQGWRTVRIAAVEPVRVGGCSVQAVRTEDVREMPDGREISEVWTDSAYQTLFRLRINGLDVSLDEPCRADDWPLELGKSWGQTCRGQIPCGSGDGRYSLSGTWRVDRMEIVAVPARSYSSFVVVGTLEGVVECPGLASMPLTAATTAWIPETTCGFAVKEVYESSRGRFRESTLKSIDCRVD